MLLSRLLHLDCTVPVHCLGNTDPTPQFFRHLILDDIETSCMAPTMRRNDANVRVNVLIIQEDSAAVISSEITNDGIAEKRAVILNASINCARQNIASNACLCA